MNTNNRLPSGKPLDTIEHNPGARALLDALRDSVFYFDTWGILQYVNVAGRARFGAQLCLGKTFMELDIGWEHASEKHREIMQVLRSGKPILDSRELCMAEAGDCYFSVDTVRVELAPQRPGVLMTMREVTQLVRRDALVRSNESRYRAYVSNSTDAIWRYDIFPPIDISCSAEQQVDAILGRSVLAECNQRLADLLGIHNINSLLGLPLDQSESPTSRLDVAAFVRDGYRLRDKEYSRSNSLGQPISLQSNAIGIVERGLLTQIWGTTRDVTEKNRYLERLEYLADHDVLTSLPNRSLLYRTIARALQERKSRQKMALLLIDLDHFKEINDTLGHLAGDKVLKQLGPRLQGQLQETSAMVARLGGDEFAVFIPNLRSAQQAAVIAHKILDCLSMVFEVEGLRTEISASVGIALAPDQAQDVSTLMRYADVAMYRAKQSLQSVTVYDAGFDPHSPKRLELMGALGAAIREDQLTLFMQPKIALQNHRVYGFEALLRWNHPEFGFIPPADFIPIAEHSNLIYPLTLWVFEKGLEYCRHWLDCGYRISVAMNLSARNLLDDRIVNELKELLERYQVPPELCELEITESAIMADPARAEAALMRIHQLGVILSIDDFGTGYSSLSYLKRLPVQTLKIDRSFVGSMVADGQDEIIVNSIVQLAHNLGLDVVAEGVENAMVYNKLVDIGCDRAQGFYMGRPVSLASADSWLNESRWGLAHSA